MAGPSERAGNAREDFSEATTAKVSLPSDREIVIERTFQAPRDVVFDAWTQAEHVKWWWDPSRQPLDVCEIDLRPNGIFRFVPAGTDGGRRTFVGRYREIRRPHRLEFVTPSPSGAESIGRLVFDEHDGATRLTLTIECVSREDRDALLQRRVEQGTMRTLNALAEYLSGKRSDLGDRRP